MYVAIRNSKEISNDRFLFVNGKYHQFTQDELKRIKEMSLGSWNEENRKRPFENYLDFWKSEIIKLRHGNSKHN